MALATLHISSDEFYDLCPVEFTHAMTIIDKQQEQQFKTSMEVARFLAVHLWNSSERSLKKPEFTAQKLIPFTWDKEVEKEPQSMNDMLNTMLGVAARGNAAAKRKSKG